METQTASTKFRMIPSQKIRNHRLRAIGRKVVRCSNEMSLEKGPSGAGFQVVLKYVSIIIIFKTDGGNQLPGAIFVGVDGLSEVVFSEATIRIRGNARIYSGGVGEAAEDIDVFTHR